MKSNAVSHPCGGGGRAVLVEISATLKAKRT